MAASLGVSQLSWLVEWSKLVVGQSPASKNVSTGGEDTVGNRHQTTTGEVVRTEKT
jgi:hypothetical protein